MTASYQSYHTAAPQGCSWHHTARIGSCPRAAATLPHSSGPPGQSPGPGPQPTPWAPCTSTASSFFTPALPQPGAAASRTPPAHLAPSHLSSPGPAGAAPTATRQPQQPRQLGPLRACRHSSLSNPTCAREPAHWSFALRLGPLPVFQGTDSPLPRTPLFTGCTRNMAPPPAFDEGLRKLPLMAEDKGEPMCARQRKRERWEVPGSFPQPVLMRTKILGLDPDTQMPSEMDLEGHANVCSLLSFTPRPSRLSGCLTPLQLESSSNGLPGLSRYFELAISSARRSCVFSGIPLQKISEYEPMPSDVASAQLLTRLFLGPSRANNLFM
ncbi:uncharacterized protein LOC129045030 [Pongo pygmaeus]|uniref:uncharacterized protein LOC129045030 n=1 Tax=Pongo pygmaeus TaxID=9600 RepID=UPI0023E1B280|nr:uncharacterized protein LOC129045030 [Pongo pygmaeus]